MCRCFLTFTRLVSFLRSLQGLVVDTVIDCGKEVQLAEILPDNITSGKSDFSLFAEADYLIEANSAKKICTLNPDIEDVDEALIIGDKVLMCERELSIPASIVNVESGRCKG
ncbi:hypothetical protein AVEN_36788-1 [Araneus ventricosus]|uniref:Uncharacterized protein n=1 Tax=Araneus ventricosus TaxID=182803 RepID=A0A4Y2KKV3_ARAVE|nr:hypothetical protein AVEN_36788-1 [Araneus ventricosus]